MPTIMTAYCPRCGLSQPVQTETTANGIVYRCLACGALVDVEEDDIDSEDLE